MPILSRSWLLAAALLGAQAAELAAPPVARAQISDGVVRIGVLNDQTGIVSDPTGMGSVEAARMAAEEFGNQVAGKPVEILVGDHVNKADVGGSIARKWYDQDKVDMITDIPNSSVALAVQAIARDRHKLVMFSAPGTTALSNESCSPYGIQWTYDTYALARGTAGAVLRNGGKSWFFITADYAFGVQLQKDATDVIEAGGSKVVGSIKHPLASNDYSSFLLQAQASKADIIGVATAGNDMIEIFKQANEFGITAGGQKMAGMLVLLTDVHALGLKVAQGAYLTTPFYWNLNAETRAWSERFAARRGGRHPTFLQIGVYEAVRHYLQAIAATGTDDADIVNKAMRAAKIESIFTHGATIRPDGRVLRDMYLAQIKTPEQSKEPWDYYNIVAKIDADTVTRPLSISSCPLVKQ